MWLKWDFVVSVHTHFSSPLLPGVFLLQGLFALAYSRMGTPSFKCASRSSASIHSVCWSPRLRVHSSSSSKQASTLRVHQPPELTRGTQASEGHCLPSYQKCHLLRKIFKTKQKKKTACQEGNPALKSRGSLLFKPPIISRELTDQGIAQVLNLDISTFHCQLWTTDNRRNLAICSNIPSLSSSKNP